MNFVNKFPIEKFNENGIAFPLKLKDEISSNIFEKEYFEFKNKSEQLFGSNISLKPHLLSKFFYKLAIDKSILENVKKIIGNNIYLWSSAFFAKAPGEGKIVSYHQDNPYWQLTTNNVVTAWIALTKSDKFLGGLEIVPKSHKLGIINKLDVKNARSSYLKGERTTKSNDLLSYNQNLKKFIDENEPVCLDMEPGEFSIHHVNTVHGSGINKGKNYRIGFALRFVSSDTRHLEEKDDLAMHICGEKNEYYRDEIPPKEDFSHESIEQYKLSMSSTGVFGNKKY